MTPNQWARFCRSIRYKAPDPECPGCGGTGEIDSGGTMPWGAAVFVRCGCTEVVCDARAITGAVEAGDRRTCESPDPYESTP
jgi:hypothetical protein